MKLTDIAIKKAKPKDKPYKLTDGDGLFLLVHPNGGRYWRFKYRANGQEKLMAFGTYPEVSLADAREKRRLNRILVAEGKDPNEVKKQKKLVAAIITENTYENIAREWHATKKPSWSGRHPETVMKKLEGDLFPDLGQRPITEITAQELLAVIRKIEKRGALDMAKRALQITGQIYRYAIITGRAQRDITADLKGALKTAKTQHRAFLREDELPEYLRKLEAYDKEGGELLTKLALKMLLLTFVRSSELRGALWSEIDFDKKEWRIPAERMKMNELHIVPLANQTIALLKEIKLLTGHREHVFPNHQSPNKIMSENTLLFALYRMGYRSRATAHGFRSTASTILNENGFRADVIERQLAHGERDNVRSAYNHAQYLKERHEMMKWWAKHIDKLKDKSPLRFSVAG